MKKLLALLLVVLMFTLVGCKKNGESTSESASEQASISTPESTPASTPDSTPESTPDSVPESTPDSVPESTPFVMTKAIWDAAFAPTCDFQMESTASMEMMGLQMTATSIQRKVGDKVYLKSTTEVASMGVMSVYEEYYAKDGDSYYNYYKGEGDAWLYREIPADDYSIMTAQSALGFEFESFAYDEEKGAYYAARIVVEEEGASLVMENIHVYFEGDKVVKITLTETVDETTMSIVAVYTYEGLTITIPEATLDQSAGGNGAEEGGAAEGGEEKFE